MTCSICNGAGYYYDSRHNHKKCSCINEPRKKRKAQKCLDCNGRGNHRVRGGVGGWYTTETCSSCGGSGKSSFEY